MGQDTVPSAGCGNGVEDRGPVGRGVGQVAAAVGPVLHDETNADPLRMIQDRGHAFREQANVLVESKVGRHLVAKPYVGDVLGGGVVQCAAGLGHLLRALGGVGRDRLADHADG